MARIGRCRCGALLKFRRGPDGYKTRCQKCNAVVRLRLGSKERAPKERKLPCVCGYVAVISTEVDTTTCPRCGAVLEVASKLPAPIPAAPAVNDVSPTRPLLDAVGSGNGAVSPAKVSSVSRPEKPVAPSPRARSASQPAQPRSGTIACEICCTLAPREATRCPACGSVLPRTAPKPVQPARQTSSTDGGAPRRGLPLSWPWLAAGIVAILVTALGLYLLLLP